MTTDPQIDPAAAVSPVPYCPLKPTDKQQIFLHLSCQEALFGGAAGGGKSVALLMGALQYVHVPGYAALILRKDTQRLSLAGGLIPRSHEWLARHDKVKWNAARRQWSFPTAGAPATITFGYLANPQDKYRYASAEFQYIAFDELTELREDDYLFLFSRLRKTKNMDVKLRVRSATNPGNSGHLWVKQRFVREWTPGGELPAGMTSENGVLHCDGRAFVPSLITDNEHLDADEYRQSLVHLMPVTRERLMNGDWTVQEKGIFQAGWFRYYQLSGEQYELLQPNGSLLVVVPQNACRLFITVDPAGTSAEGDEPADHRSFSVIQVWAQPRAPELSHFLILREQFREQYSLAALGKRIKGVQTTWKTERIWIEDEKLGHALVTELRKVTPPIPVEAIATRSKSKEARAIPLANKMERGEVFLPQYHGSWRLGFERELLAWTAHKRQASDQIDAAAYAAITAENQVPGILTIQPLFLRA